MLPAQTSPADVKLPRPRPVAARAPYRSYWPPISHSTPKVEESAFFLVCELILV